MNAPKTIKRRSIHSGRLERWLGAEKVEKLANDMRNGGGQGNRWYWKPICLLDVPGSVWVTADGDFVGDFDRGWFDSALDSFRRHTRALWEAAGRPIYRPEPVFGAGFASISDALSRASQGNSQTPGGQLAKTGSTGVSSVTNSLWRVGAQPAAGSVGAAAPGGTVPTSATTGAMSYTNPASGTLHLTGADMATDNSQNTLLLYDRLFSVNKTMNSTATESVTGVPTRYQSSTTTAADYIGGNFLFINVGGTALAATAHNWTVCTYTDQTGTASTLPSVIGNASAIIDRFDMPTMAWFCPLETGDVGIKALTQMQCSALVATGVVEFCIGHPIGFMSFPNSNATIPFDWLTNRNLAPRIFDNACLAFLEINKPSTAATRYNGQIYVTSAAP